MSSEGNSPFPCLVGSCFYCSPAFSGAEAGRRPLGGHWSNDLTLREQALFASSRGGLGLESMEFQLWAVPSEGGNVSVVSLLERVRECSMVWGQSLPSRFLGCHILLPLCGNARN